jgi:lysozyme family protein
MPFDHEIERVLDNEGGYVNNPADPGGETKFGISKRSYPNVDIANLTRDQAKALYLRDFWTPVHGDDLPPMVAFMALDFAVNSGIQTSIRKLQAAAGVADDGHWGEVTQAAVKAANPVVLVLRLLAEHVDFRRKLSTFKTFGAGWDGRLANDLRFIATEVPA